MNKHRINLPRIYVFGIRGFPNIPGGAEKHCEELYPIMSEKGYLFYIFRRKPYVNCEPNQKVHQRIQFIDIWTIQNKYFEVLIHSFIATIISIFDKPEIIHIHNIGACLFLPLIKLFRIPVVVTYHSRNYLHKKWGIIASLIFRTGELFVKFFADKIIAVSKHHCTLLPSDKSTYIPNGVVIAKSPSTAWFLDNCGLKKYKYILFAGRLVPEKGVFELIDSFLHLKTDFSLVLAGDVNQEPKYIKKLTNLSNGNDRIIFTGYVSKKPLTQLFTYARLFVLPSYHEGMPLALLEAMSCGLSVLVSDIPAHLEVELKKERYFKCGDVEDLKKKIKKLLNTRISDGEKNNWKNQIKKKYNWKKIAEETARVYEKTLKK